MNEMLLCALKRHGEPATASELYDVAVGLAIDSGWPRRTWTATSVKQAAALLKGMVARGLIERVGDKRENGRDTPAYAPRASGDPTQSRWDKDAPLPSAPELSPVNHPLNGMNKRQQFVVFDLMETALNNYARQHSEIHDMLRRHNRELSDAAARAKRELLAAGVSDGDGQ